MKRAFVVAVLSLAIATVVRATNGTAPAGQQSTPPAQAAPPQALSKDTDEGIPVTNDLTVQVCGECHKVDGKFRMSRISYRRTTPEGWQETIRRMVTLNKAQIDPNDARVIVKYLSDNHGLAPEEARPGAWESERRLIDYTYAANADTAGTCSACHSMGRVILQRRNGEDWDLLVAMHRGWYPLVDNQSFRRFGPPSSTPGPDGRPPDNRHPMDKALAHLKGAFPLKTPEWSAWSATMRRPRIEGTWALTGYEPSEGLITGRVVIAAGATPDEFTTTTSFTYTKSGRSVSRAGRAVVYTGFQWRGRTTVGSDDNTSLREVMFIDRGWQAITGRWFAGAYDELGIDITLTRVGRDPVISGLDLKGLKRGVNGQTVRVFGENLPAAVTAADLDLGPGVTITRASISSPNVMSLVVDVGAEAPLGPRDLSLAGQVTRSAIAVYEKVDYLKVTPGWGMARVGGVMYPKMLARFEAIAWSHGPDGKPDTRDDIDLGLVDATWSIEEYTATFDDDDVKFVGEIERSRGVFTPAVDGPNPKRSGNRNNVGDVWIVAAYRPDGGDPLRARAHLVVTVPLYMRWDFFTINQQR
jgi:quinohemoprotein amine dehydrogenase